MAFANRSSSFALEDRSTESEPAGTFRSLPERRVESLGCVPCARSTPTLLMFTRSILILESLPPSGTYRQGFIKTLLQNAHAGRFDRRHKNQSGAVDNPAVPEAGWTGRQSELQSVRQRCYSARRPHAYGRKIGPTELYLQSVNSLRHARNDSAFHIRPIRNPADCRMIDSNTGAGVAGGEATHNKSALGEGINVSVWAN